MDGVGEEPTSYSEGRTGSSCMDGVAEEPTSSSEGRTGSSCMDGVGEEPTSSSEGRTGSDWKDKKTHLDKRAKKDLVQARSEITLMCNNVIAFVCD